MAPSRPKALLFDIGGVCVVSPFQAILDYEIAHHIPPGYINHTISATSPNGSWQRIERGEIILDESFFTLFKQELEDPKRWDAHWRKILADPGKRELIPPKFRQEIEKAGSEGGKAGGGGGGYKVPPMPDINAKEMFWNMMRMARSPDPYMYPALKALSESGEFIVAALSNTMAFPPGIRDDKGNLFINGIPKSEIAAVRKASGLLEVGSPLDGGAGAGVGGGDEKEDIRSNFQAFVSSAHVGMRKPERRIYELALDEIRRLGRERGWEDIKAEDVVFLDDIGSNLKAAREFGLGTIKVTLGKSRDAVKELEERVGMKLLGDKSKL